MRVTATISMAAAAARLAEAPGRSLPAPAVRSGLAPAELSVVLPTYNEAANIRTVIARIGQALAGTAWEIIVVDDDSADGTAALARAIAATDARVRVIRRIGRRGLAGACIEGILASSAPFVAVMDADLQHDEALLPAMLALLRADQADLVVASRRLAAPDGPAGLTAARQLASKGANALARRLLKLPLSDPMSGFFMIRRPLVEAVAGELAASGFKILLDLVASAKAPIRIRELPFLFRARRRGESKLDLLVALDTLGLLLSRSLGPGLGRLVSVRCLAFALIGLAGLVVHLLGLRVLLDQTELSFEAAQLAATWLAMTTNFFCNNQLTFRDRRLTGWRALGGLASFYAVCSVGALANLGVASWLFGHAPIWWLAGAAGALMGAVWNYAASSALTWAKV